MKKHVFYREYPGLQRFVWNVFDSDLICIATLRTLNAAMYACSV